MKVSIIMAVYNQPELVVRALDSVPRRNDIELIIIDDGSTDTSYEVLKWYKENNPDLNIILIHQENHGLGYCKNIGYSIATGEYIYELDNDDYLYTDVFIKALDELDGTDMIYVSCKVNDGRIFWVDEKSKNGYVAGFTRFIRREFLGDNRTKEDIWNEDLYFNNLLQALPHTEKFTKLVPYHYNFPREGSMYWEATH